MKNHIVFKFIAVLLCAASLLGAVGGVLGVVLLTSGGLYDVTVEEMVSTQASQDSADLADWLVKNYASTELGGASETLVLDHFGDHWFTNKYDDAHFGYAILDAEGEELMSVRPELKEKELYACESFTGTGKYIHVVSMESETQKQERQRAQRESALGEDVVLDEAGTTVPAEGVIVEQVIFAGANGETILDLWDDGSGIVVSTYDQDGNSSHGIHMPHETLGFLYYSPQGNLIFQTFFDYESYVEPFRDTEVYEAYFNFRDGQVRLRQEGVVGQLYMNDSGHLVFLSIPMEPVVEETVPETTEETVPETTEATVPPTVAETLPPETVPAENYEDAGNPESTEYSESYTEMTEASNASDVPETLEAPAENAEPIPVDSLPAETAPAETIAVETIPAETVPVETEETVPQETVPTVINGKPLEEYQILSDTYYDRELGESVTAKFVYVPLPELTVEVYMTEAALRYANGYRALELVRDFRNYLLPMIGICLLVFAVFGVYLCTAAGKKPKSEEIRAGGLNRLPLDLYLFGGGLGVACIIAVGGELAIQLLEQDFWTGCGMLLGIGVLSSLLLVGFCFAFVAQVKTPGGFWWRNTLCGHGIRLFMKFAVWLEAWLRTKGFPAMGRLVKKFWLQAMKAMAWLYKNLEKVLLWTGAKCRSFFQWLWKKLHRGLSLLPVTWQWLVAGVVIIVFVMLAFQTSNEFIILLCLLVPVAIILYSAYCFGILSESTKRMSKGDLETKVEDQMMIGCFKESAADLNALADVAVVAAQKQLKSERMKTELITNVSHDIKTPLTSIINYVDLLQKPHTEEEGEQYLEVLDRQSQRLKKLIDDLMDMSKANTGNMQVEITTVDAVESVNQALGEFSDKLDRARLTPVFRHNSDHMTMRADGRLVWRVLSNLLGNAVKYAMPGTRLYIDLMELEGKVIISLKNISREELNVDAEELMERFVRGDDSRNTEGSGLGLNIAKSLMELQKGQMQLLVDGDLFKVTLIFPGC